MFEYIQKKNHPAKNLSSYTSLLGVLPTVDSIFSFNLNFTIDLRHRGFEQMEITLHRITLTSRTVIHFYTTHIFPYLCYHSFLKIILIIFINPAIIQRFLLNSHRLTNYNYRNDPPPNPAVSSLPAKASRFETIQNNTARHESRYVFIEVWDILDGKKRRLTN